LAGGISLYAGTTKNDGARQIPIVPQLRAALVEQRVQRQAGCPYVCFRLDRRGHPVKIGGFRKAWQRACIKAEFGKMEPATDAETGHPRSKLKVRMVYRGLIFHDLRRSAVRNLVRAGVPETVARQITGHKTRSVFDRYNIVSENDLADAGRTLAIFHENGDKTGTLLHQNAAVISVMH
jgi:integrase